MADLATGPLDFTSRDFAAIRDDLLSAVQNRLPAWSGASDPNDYLRVLIEAFAFVGDINNYYIDRIANEALLSTATQRQTLINIARMVGYPASGPTSASVALNVTNGGVASYTLPSGTVVYGSYNYNGSQVQVTFETAADLVLAAGASGSVTATEGTTKYGSTALQSNGDPTGYALSSTAGAGASDGTPSQVFVIPLSPVIEGSVAVWAHAPASADGLYFTQVTNVIEAAPGDRVFTVMQNADDTALLTFGDGSSGWVPPNTYTIRATFRIGVGERGNISAGTLNQFGTTVTGAAVPATVTVSNPSAAAGGAPTESAESIRAKAGRGLRTCDRVVTAQDVEDLAVFSGGVDRANALGSAMSNLIVYVTPYASTDDQQPGFLQITATITTASTVSGTCTFTTTAAHGLTVGTVVNVNGLGYPFDGTWLVATAPGGTPTVFTVALGFSSTLSTSVGGLLVAVGAETAAFTTFKSNAQTAILANLPAGTGLMIASPLYTDLRIKITINLSDSARQSVSRGAVTTALLSAFAATTLDFGARIYSSQAVIAALTVSGVISAQVTTFATGLAFSLNAGTSGLSTYESITDPLNAAPYEIYRLLTQNVTVLCVGGIADL